MAPTRATSSPLNSSCRLTSTPWGHGRGEMWQTAKCIFVALARLPPVGLRPGDGREAGDGIEYADSPRTIAPRPWPTGSPCHERIEFHGDA
eukprot:6519627-Pyramimonas_sp.AAC.1